MPHRLKHFTKVVVVLWAIAALWACLRDGEYSTILVFGLIGLVIGTIWRRYEERGL